LAEKWGLDKVLAGFDRASRLDDAPTHAAPGISSTLAAPFWGKAKVQIMF
jgi:hypothetical protein